LPVAEAHAEKTAARGGQISWELWSYSLNE
jgi:hypothetical protein